MSTTPIAPQTAQEIEALFDTVFSKLQPVSASKPVTMADRLKPYKTAILNQRRRGFTWSEIAAVMAQPPISFKVSARNLGAIFGAAPLPKTPKKKDPRAVRAIHDPNSGEVFAQVDRGGHITQVPYSGPTPMNAAEEQRFRPLLEGLIPPIVQAKMKRRDARFYASSAVETWKTADSERFVHVCLAELDGLTEANCGRYGLAPATIAPFLRAWNASRG